jgi:hypothetical protein
VGLEQVHGPVGRGHLPGAADEQRAQRQRDGDGDEVHDVREVPDQQQRAEDVDDQTRSCPHSPPRGEGRRGDRGGGHGPARRSDIHCGHQRAAGDVDQRDGTEDPGDVPDRPGQDRFRGAEPVFEEAGEHGEARQDRDVAEGRDGERRPGEDGPPPSVLESGHTVRKVITRWDFSYLGDKSAEEDAKGNYDDESDRGERVSA